LANIKSAIKRARQSEKRRVRNRVVRSSSRTFVREANTSIAADEKTEAAQAVLVAISALDKAAQKGIVHRNNAARRKSRLMKRFNALQS
jgi:small subunit ribosomal protein S20